jgi:hypothetical protein
MPISRDSDARRVRDHQISPIEEAELLGAVPRTRSMEVNVNKNANVKRSRERSVAARCKLSLNSEQRVHVGLINRQAIRGDRNRNNLPRRYIICATFRYSFPLLLFFSLFFFFLLRGTLHLRSDVIMIIFREAHAFFLITGRTQGGRREQRRTGRVDARENEREREREREREGDPSANLNIELRGCR